MRLVAGGAPFSKEGDDRTGIANNPYRKQLPYWKCRNEAP